MPVIGPPLVPGTVVAGRYRTLGLLGQGGMARVYVARDLVLERCVALKVFRGERGGTDVGAGWQRFAREARNGARLSHPLIAAVYDFGRDDRGAAFLATELQGGPSLRDELSRRGAFPVDEAVRVAANICDALAHAHARDVLHRDLKPENVVFREVAGDAVLIDFGLSLLRDDAPLTAVGSCVGSPTYLAPERILERGYDGRADLYAAGIILYELLAGAPPFTDRAPGAIARRHITDTAVPIQDRVRVSPALAAIVARALAKDPAQRFSSAAEMRRALDGASCHRVSRRQPTVVGHGGAAPSATTSATSTATSTATPSATSSAVIATTLEIFAPRRLGLRRLLGWLRFGRWRRPYLRARSV